MHKAPYNASYMMKKKWMEGKHHLALFKLSDTGYIKITPSIYFINSAFETSQIIVKLIQLWVKIFLHLRCNIQDFVWNLNQGV